MVWMRLSPLLLCVAALVLFATGAVGRPIQRQSIHSPIIEGLWESSQTRL